MAYEKDYEALLTELKKIDTRARQLMKGIYRRELENDYMREVIANLLHRSRALSERERADLMRALQYDPWREAKQEFEELLGDVKSRLGSKTFIGED